MNLSFVPGELKLFKEGGEYIVTIQGEEVFRSKIEKKALKKYNDLRKEMETQFPAHEWTSEEKRALLSRIISESKVGLRHNSVREPKKKIAKSRTFG